MKRIISLWFKAGMFLKLGGIKSDLPAALACRIFSIMQSLIQAYDWKIYFFVKK